MKKFGVLVIMVIALMVLGCILPPEDGIYSVLYYANAEDVTGFPPVDSNEYTTGMEATVLGKNTLEKPGYTFQYWNTRSNNTGTSYSSGDIIKINYTSVFLYAIWAESSD